MTSNLELPKPLVDGIRDGQVGLFLGAGATVGAIHPENSVVPMGPALGDLLARKFLNPSFSKMSLAQISEIAVSETDLFTVQEYIREIFEPFQPAEFHLLVPRFRWPVICTTNYDLVLERSYGEEPSALQRPVRFLSNFDKVDEQLRSRDTFPYIKLHGCITEIRNLALPLILTVDQYIQYKLGRSRLFERFKEIAYERSFVFIGYKLSDPNIRSTLHYLSELGNARPRSYMVSPGITEQESRMWEGKRVATIDCDYEQFLRAIDGAISKQSRVLSKHRPSSGHPIKKMFAVSNETRLSEDLDCFLRHDVDFVHAHLKTEPADPNAFYKGHFEGWSSILQDLDIRRTWTERLLTDAVLDAEDGTGPRFYLLKGHAGSGKTVALHRAAWEAATDLDARNRSGGQAAASAISALA